jgi:hypothetical protein
MDAEQPVSKSIRGSTWSDEETRCLLNIWSEQKIQEELDKKWSEQAKFLSLTPPRLRGNFNPESPRYKAFILITFNPD